MLRQVHSGALVITDILASVVVKVVKFVFAAVHTKQMILFTTLQSAQCGGHYLWKALLVFTVLTCRPEKGKGKCTKAVQSERQAM